MYELCKKITAQFPFFKDQLTSAGLLTKDDKPGPLMFSVLMAMASNGSLQALDELEECYRSGSFNLAGNSPSDLNLFANGEMEKLGRRYPNITIFKKDGWRVIGEEIQRIDEDEIFSSDAEAIAHVFNMAAAGDPKCREAIEKCYPNVRFEDVR